MGYEAWLIRRNADPSKRNVATGIIAFDFELFICENSVHVVYVSAGMCEEALKSNRMVC